jgi:hypothetical protein
MDSVEIWADLISKNARPGTGTAEALSSLVSSLTFQQAA